MFPVEPPAGKPPAPRPSVELCRGLGENRLGKTHGPDEGAGDRAGTASRRSTGPVTVRPGPSTGVACRPADGHAGRSGSLLPGLARLGAPGTVVQPAGDHGPRPVTTR